MKTLRFEKITYRNHKIVEKKSIYVWHDVTPRTARIICQNFFDGFCLAFNHYYRVPVHPWSMGYVISSWNLHKDGSGWEYRFVNGLGRLVKFK